MRQCREWTRRKVEPSAVPASIAPQPIRQGDGSLIGGTPLPTPSAPQILGATGLRSVALVLGAALTFGVTGPFLQRVDSLGPGRFVQDATRDSRQAGRRLREMEWKKANVHQLREQYEGSWVVLEGDRVVSHGVDPVEVVKEARAKGVRHPYVFLVERERKNVAWLGL